MIIADSSISCRGSGVDLLEWIRERESSKAIPFIILSGQVSGPSKERAEVAGVNLIITKTHDFAETTEQLRKALGQMQMLSNGQGL